MISNGSFQSGGYMIEAETSAFFESFKGFVTLVGELERDILG